MLYDINRAKSLDRYIFLNIVHTHSIIICAKIYRSMPQVGRNQTNNVNAGNRIKSVHTQGNNIQLNWEGRELDHATNVISKYAHTHTIGGRATHYFPS